MADNDFQVPRIGDKGKGFKANPRALSPDQVKVYELMVQSLRVLRDDRWGLGIGILGAMFAAFLGALVGGLLVTAVGWSMNRLSGPTWVIYTVGLIPLLITLLLVSSSKWGLLEHIVLDTRAGARYIQFQRLEIAIGIGWAMYAVFLGSMLGIQIQLMYLTESHCGLEIGGEWTQCAGIACDNLTHGVFLDAGELYDLRIGEHVTHTRTSAALFFFFRTTCDAIVVILIFALWYRRRVVHITMNLDPLLAEPTPDALVRYLRSVCYGAKNWASTYHDEFVFFCLVEKYLAGRYDQCHLLAELFPDVGFPAQVRELFKGTDGKLLVPTATAGSV